MANVRIADVRKALPLAKQLVKKLEVDKTPGVSHDEVGRIRVRDNFVARNLVSSAMRNLSYPDRAGPYAVTEIQGELEKAIDSLTRADRNQDGQLDTGELARASKVAKNFVDFAKKYNGKAVSVFDIKPWEKPGSAEWVSLVKKDYFGRPGEPMNRPYFGRSLLIAPADLPNAALRKAFTTLKTQNPGATVEATSSEVNGEKVFYMHAMYDSRYETLLLDKKGKVLATGTAKPKANNASAKWTLSWR